MSVQGNVSTFAGVGGRSALVARLTDTLVAVNEPIITYLNDYAFHSCKNMEQAQLDNLQTIGSYAFAGCIHITRINFPKVWKILEYAFSECSGIRTLVLGGIDNTETSSIPARVFTGCNLVEAIDCGLYGFGSNSFNGCTNLKTLVLRRTKSVANAGSNNIFTNTPFASGGTGGTLYVPRALISSYQSASNWSTFLAYPNNSIQAIEDSQYATKYVDGTTINS